MRPLLHVPLLLVGTALLGACASHPPPDETEALAHALASAPVVLLGEVHDNAAQHALRARALAQWLDTGPRPALLMEQFDREHQGDLDRAMSRPGVTPEEVIAAGAPGDPAMQGWSWPLYRPYVALAIRYRLPIVAANVSREDTRRVLKEGLLATGFEPKVPEDIEAAQARAILDGHCGLIDEPTARRMVDAQVARDQFMARSLERNAARGAVLLAGDGHVRRDVGVPRWLSPSVRQHSVAIGLVETGDASGAAYDLAFSTPAQARPDPCDAMRPPAAR